MNKVVKILDAASIVFLTLLCLNFLLLFGLQGSPVGRLFPSIPYGWDEVIFFGLVAMVTGAVIHLLSSYGTIVPLVFISVFWVILSIVFVAGIFPPEYTREEIAWRLVAFTYPLLYIYLVKTQGGGAYFKGCAWLYTALTLWVVASSLADGGGSVLTGAAGLIPWVITVVFTSVSLYLVYRLLTVR